MKKLKEFNWKNWVLVYLVFAVLLGIISKIAGRSIHGPFIFTAVLLIHLLISIKNQKEARMKYPTMAFISLIIIQMAVSEFYGKPLSIYNLDIIKTAFIVLFLIFLVSYIRNKLKERKIVREDIDKIVEKQPKEKEIDMVNPEESKKTKE